MITPVILSGGGGTRLWPLSRTHVPKQYWPLVSEKTLLQETALRIKSSKTFEAPLVICNQEHRFLAAEQLRAIEIKPAEMVLETDSRNTAPAIATACLLQKNLDAILLVLPADHSIKQPEDFHQAILDAVLPVMQGKIVTFGITPTKPETRYGYIEKGTALKDAASIFTIARFIEKPDLQKAQTLFQQNDYYWNSGIFMFKARTMLEELTRFCPTLLKECEDALAIAKKDLDFLRIGSHCISPASSISIDYAVMEHTDKAVVKPVQFDWSDVGTWDALWEISEKDEMGNVKNGDILTNEVSQSYLHTEDQLLAVIGLHNIAIVATKDAILVTHKEKLQQIHPVLQTLKDNNRPELQHHKSVYRPWGSYQSIDLGPRFQVKRITVKPGAKTSTQIHFHRAEHWVVVEGTAKVTRGDDSILVHENESIYLPMGIKHSVENPGKIPLHLIEVQTGSYLGEDDIVRIEDAYGRITPLG